VNRPVEFAHDKLIVQSDRVTELMLVVRTIMELTHLGRAEATHKTWASYHLGRSLLRGDTNSATALKRPWRVIWTTTLGLSIRTGDSTSGCQHPASPDRESVAGEPASPVEPLVSCQTFTSGWTGGALTVRAGTVPKLGR
jgi:hypothetical protein